MTRDSEFLDRQWDALVRGRIDAETDPTLRQVHAQRPGEPSSLFVSQLRNMIEVAAQELPRSRRTASIRMAQPAREVVADEPKLLPQPVPAYKRPGRMRGLSFAGNMASAVMAAALLIAMVAAVVRYPFGGSDGSDSPTTGSQGTSIQAPASPTATDGEDGLSSADPGRTGVQPGPGPLGVPVIVGEADVIGSAMALGDGKIMVVDRDRLTAIDAESLETVWSVELPHGLYTTPVIAGDAIYLGYTEIREGITEYTLGADHNNQLVSISLADGSENWRIDGAGAFPIEPLVADGIVHAVGSDGDAYQLNAVDPRDGSTIWTAEPFVGPEMPENSYPQSPPYLDMSLAFGNGLIAVNQLYELSAYDAENGDQVWSQPADEPEVVGEPVIADGVVIATFGHHQATQDSEPGRGRVAAFELETGTERWSNASLASDKGTVYIADIAATGEQIVYGGFWEGEDSQIMTALGEVSGEPEWRVPLWGDSADPTLNYWASKNLTALVGDTIYTVSEASVQGNQRRSLISAVGLEAGERIWTVVIDGTVQSAPIVTGGNVYLLTDLYGMHVLGDEPDAVATPEDGVSDLRAPARCAATPIEYPLPGQPDEETPAVPGYAGWAEAMPLTDVPAVDSDLAVPTDVQAAVEGLMLEFHDCNVQGDHELLFGLFSDDYYIRLRDVDPEMLEGKNGENGWMAVMLVGSSARIDLDVATLQYWPDGRVGGVVRSNMDTYLSFVEEDGEWKIDEFHRIMDVSTEPEPSPES